MPCTCQYTIKWGDSWEMVASYYKTSPKGLKALNPAYVAGGLPAQKAKCIGCCSGRNDGGAARGGARLATRAPRFDCAWHSLTSTSDALGQCRNTRPHLSAPHPCTPRTACLPHS